MSELTATAAPAKASNVNGERQRLLAAVTAQSEHYKHQAQQNADQTLDAARNAAYITRQAADDKLSAAGTNAIGAFYVLFEGQFSQLNYKTGKLEKTLQHKLVQSSALDVHRNLRFSIVAPEKDADPQVTTISSTAIDDFNAKDEKQLYQYDPSKTRTLPTAGSAIAADPSKQALFWLDSAGVVHTSGYDGSNPKAVLQIDRTGGDNSSLAVDSQRQRLYCLEPNAVWQIEIGTWKRTVYANPVLHPESHEPKVSTAAIAVNEPTGYIYWTLGGDIIETESSHESHAIVAPPGGCLALAIEPTSHTLFWVNGALNRTSDSVQNLEKQLTPLLQHLAQAPSGSLFGFNPSAALRKQIAVMQAKLLTAQAEAFQYQIHRLYLGSETAKPEPLGQLPSFRTRQIFIVSSYDEAKLELVAAKHAKAHDLKMASEQVTGVQNQAAASRNTAQQNYQTAHDTASQNIRNAQVSATQQQNVAKRQLESQRTQARQTKATAQSNHQQRLDDAHRDYNSRGANAHQKATQITSAANAKLRDAQSKR